MQQPKFKLGQVVATRDVACFIGDDIELNQGLRTLLDRHASGDWGITNPEDCQANEQALALGLRILSVYMLGGREVWIITEADRSSTTVLFPEDY